MLFYCYCFGRADGGGGGGDVGGDVNSIEARTCEENETYELHPQERPLFVRVILFYYRWRILP